MKLPRLLIVLAVVAAGCAAEDPVAVTTEAADTTVVETTAAPPETSTMPMEEHEDAAHEEDQSTNDAAHGSDDAVVEGRMIQVTMSEFAFEPASIEVSAGETVTFMIENTGLIEHEFRLSNSHRIEEHIASGHADHEDGAEGHHDEGGDVTVLVAAGETAQLTFEVPEDATVYTHVACLLPDHYEAGMVADLTTSS